MKTKRITFVAFLIAALMMLTIGFAALTDDLFVNGTANIGTTQSSEAFDQKVYFSDAEVVNGGAGDSASVGTTDPDTASFHVESIGLANQSVTFKFTIKNESTQANAIITIDENNPIINNTDMFKVEYMDAEGNVLDHEDTLTCEVSKTVSFLVKVTLKASPLDEVRGVFNINLTATAENA